MTDPSFLRCPTSTKLQIVSNINLVLSPRWGLTRRLTGRLTVGRIMILTLNNLFSFRYELVARQSPAGKDISTEAEQSTLLITVTK